MTKQVTLYQLECESPLRVFKREFSVGDKDKINVRKDGTIEITFIDKIYDNRNGNWMNDYERGYKTLKQAKDAILKALKEEYNDRVKEVKSLRKF